MVRAGRSPCKRARRYLGLRFSTQVMRKCRLVTERDVIDIRPPNSAYLGNVARTPGAGLLIIAPSVFAGLWIIAGLSIIATGFKQDTFFSPR